jgi:predicted lipase
MIDGPVIVGGAAQGNPGPLVDNPGHYVSIRADTNPKMALFYLRHQTRISRIVSPASVALIVVRSLRSTKEYKENFKVTSEQPVINEKDRPRTM